MARPYSPAQVAAMAEEALRLARANSDVRSVVAGMVLRYIAALIGGFALGWAFSTAGV